jgi:hypothetical protein
MEGSLSQDYSLDYTHTQEALTTNEASRLEQQLALSEYKYSQDIARLQQALLRTKRLQSLYLVCMQLRLRPVVQGVFRLVLSCAFYKWKSRCNLQSNYRIRKARLVVCMRLRIVLMREFTIFRERTLLVKAERALGSLPAMQGAQAPVVPPDDY